MSKSIVDKPYEFACQWYDVDDIHRCITSSTGKVTATQMNGRKVSFTCWVVC